MQTSLEQLALHSLWIPGNPVQGTASHFRLSAQPCVFALCRKRGTPKRLSPQGRTAVGRGFIRQNLVEAAAATDALRELPQEHEPRRR